jgi:hypothetical protein
MKPIKEDNVSAIASIAAKVLFYIAQVVFWLFIVKAVELGVGAIKNMRLPRVWPVKA